MEQIERLPKIPQTLRLAAHQRKLIPFIGAGVSQLGGCPNWQEFADAALSFFVKEKKLSHAQLDQISHLPSRIKLSMAVELQRQHDLPIEFEKLIEPSSEDKKEIGNRVYANLSKLATTFVTTNYDDWLDKQPPMDFLTNEPSPQSRLPETSRRIFYKRSDISVENLDIPNAVFHIHGSIRDRESMVLTTVDYLDCYSSHRIDGKGNRENPFLTFLQTLFQLKNVLFIGYGLNELEVLEYVVQKGIKQRTNTNEELRHYVLQGFFTHEMELVRSLKSYFRQFGVGLLPFSRDELDWDQLARVIEYLASELTPGPPLRLPRRFEMEDLLS
jgi:hypothetical protein